MKETEGSGCGGYIFGLFCGAVMAAFQSGSVISNGRPASIYESGDLNKDGVRDQIVERVDGRKIPMYGIKNEDGSISYHTSDEIRKKALDEVNAATPDYETIEKRLNEEDS
jgi:hypothetical protein